MTAQKRPHIGAAHAVVALSALGLVALGSALSCAPEADAARPRLIRDACSQTSGGGEGLECNSADDLLIRTQNEDGSCGGWVCCPPNGDGTYDCTRGSSPSGSQLGAGLGNVVAPRATVNNPNVTPDPSPARRAPQRTRRRGN